MKEKIKILLASPRGFCAGVDRAIEIVNKALRKYGEPVYVRHEIVHNKQVVEDLKKRGAIFVEELSEIKDVTRPVIFSAHGVPKKVPEEAKLKNLSYVDATCPLVSKVHRESEQHYKNGYDIILIGHKNHPEVIGTMGQLPAGSIKLIETVEDVKSLNIKDFIFLSFRFCYPSIFTHNTLKRFNSYTKIWCSTCIALLQSGLGFCRDGGKKRLKPVKNWQKLKIRIFCPKLHLRQYIGHSCAISEPYTRHSRSVQY